jgi:hypothetical protein
VTDEIHAPLDGKGKIRALRLQGLTDVALQQTMRRRDNHAKRALTSCQFVLKALHEARSLPELSLYTISNGPKCACLSSAKVLPLFDNQHVSVLENSVCALVIAATAGGRSVCRHHILSLI